MAYRTRSWNFPHEVGKEKKTLAKIDQARTLYFLNDEYAYGELGNALHYIQDKWVDNASILTEASLFDDNGLLEHLEELVLYEQIRAQYRQIAKNLIDIKNSGIEAWFDHSWGIWHKDYASCVFVFADIVELMLPTLEPNIDQTRRKQVLLEYVNSKRFENATREGFLASIITNFLYPKLSGYPAAMYSLASMNPPLDDKATKAINLNIVYKLCLELARHTLSPSSIFKFEDDWSVKAEKAKHFLCLIIPEYHELIKLITLTIQKRNNRFFDEGRISSRNSTAKPYFSSKPN
jgi:hypothetical protein